MPVSLQSTKDNLPLLVYQYQSLKDVRPPWHMRWRPEFRDCVSILDRELDVTQCIYLPGYFCSQSQQQNQIRLTHLQLKAISFAKSEVSHRTTSKFGLSLDFVKSERQRPNDLGLIVNQITNYCNV